MSDIDQSPSAETRVRTLDWSDVGLSFRRRIEHLRTGRTLDTPTKVTPAGRLSDDAQISEDSRGANEFYRQVNTGSLKSARDEGDGVRLDSLDEDLQHSRAEDFDFTFLEYTDTHRISKIEAYQMAGILENYSDYLPVPIQPELYRNIDPDNGLDDPMYKEFRDGTELFLRACHEHDTKKQIMGGIPPLDLEYVEDIINLYELYDVEAFYVDFDWNLPTVRDKVARMQYLMRRVANQRYHEDVLFYGINMRRGTLDEDVGYAPAADFAAVMMGIDIVGDNHMGLRAPPEVYEEVEKNKTNEEGEPKVAVFVRDILGYIKPPVTRWDKHFPEKTGLEEQAVMSESIQSKTARKRFEKLMIAEQMEFSLAELREALEEGDLSEYLDDRGPSEELVNAGQSVSEAFQEGLQSTLGEWT